MKNFCITLILICIISLTVAVGIKSDTTSAEYLRIHIRANSNSVEDQSVKYEIKDILVSYLTPYIAECESKQEAENLLNEKRTKLNSLIDGLLKEKGFSYTSNVVVRNEKFPTRVYGEFTLDEGFYDAVIVELGKANGDNWWCVVYPPLCFTSNACGVKYKSKILEIIKEFKEKTSA
ncbi:MAG: stage II sporulation protein R [Clostridia bacterium]|nr:stage II sporulation protein R [Clostridia bacterium]